MLDLDIATDPPIGFIPIHFDVPVHYIPYSTFAEAASRTRAVIDVFNRDLFDGQIEYEFLVFPPEEARSSPSSALRWPQDATAWSGRSARATSAGASSRA